MIDCDVSPCFHFAPGLVSQDMVTIPLELAAVALISTQFEPPSISRWPFAHETANGVRRPTRHPGSLAAAMGSAVMLPLVGSLLANQPQFKLWPQVSGLIHTHLLTEMFTVSAKVGFGRKRPFYDTEARLHRERVDDRMSFFSGHSSHAFAFATYGSLMAQHYVSDVTTRWIFTGMFYATSSWIASSRAVDGQHNWSDVAVGALVGSSVAWFVSQRTNAASGDSISVTAGMGTLGVHYTLE